MELGWRGLLGSPTLEGLNFSPENDMRARRKPLATRNANTNLSPGYDPTKGKYVAQKLKHTPTRRMVGWQPEVAPTPELSPATQVMFDQAVEESWEFWEAEAGIANQHGASATATVTAVLLLLCYIAAVALAALAVFYPAPTPELAPSTPQQPTRHLSVEELLSAWEF